MTASDPADTLRRLRRVRQVRQFTPEPVTDAALDAIVDVGRWSGSSRNSQPWRFIVLRRRRPHPAHRGDGPAPQPGAEHRHGGHRDGHARDRGGWIARLRRGPSIGADAHRHLRPGPCRRAALGLHRRAGGRRRAARGARRVDGPVGARHRPPSAGVAGTQEPARSSQATPGADGRSRLDARSGRLSPIGH